MCLADQVLLEICNETMVKGLWKKLKKTYIDKNMTNKLWLKKKLYSLRILEGGNLISHLQKFNQICLNVMSLDMNINEEDRALLLLCSLLGSLDSLITTLVYRKDILVYEKVVGVLRSNVQREKIFKKSFNSKVLAMNERYERWRERVRDNLKDRSKS